MTGTSAPSQPRFGPPSAPGRSRAVGFLRVGLNPQNDTLNLPFVSGGTCGHGRDVLTLGPETCVGKVGAQEAKTAGPVLLNSWRGGGSKRE